MVLTSKEWSDKHATEYDASYEGNQFFQIYTRVTWEKNSQTLFTSARALFMPRCVVINERLFHTLQIIVKTGKTMWDEEFGRDNYGSYT